MKFLYVLKIYHVRNFIVWKKGFGTIPRRCGIRSKPQHRCRKFVLYNFLEIALRAQDQAYIRGADSCVRIVRVSFGLIFQKLIYLLIKRYISHFNTSQVHLNFWLCSKPTLGFRIQRHWGMGARVVRGTKCNVYTSMCVDIGNPVRPATIWSPCASLFDTLLGILLGRW